MKVGDKIYCIKNISKFEAGKFYSINDMVTLYSNGHFCEVEVIVNYISFDLIKNFRYRIYFYDYFITNKEYRKQKLNKLKEVNIC